MHQWPAIYIATPRNEKEIMGRRVTLKGVTLAKEKMETTQFHVEPRVLTRQPDTVV